MSQKQWTEQDFAGDDEYVGIPWSHFEAAISVWSWVQRREITVAETAKVFNTSCEIIVRAVLNSSHMHLVGPEGSYDLQFIEHDGE